MFNKLKQMQDLRSQAKKMQSALAGESIVVDKRGIKVIMSGNLEITKLEITEEGNVAERVKDACNDAIKQTQRLMAKKMQEVGGFPGMS